MVTSLDANKGSMQQQLHELMDLCTSLQRQQTQMVAKIQDQDLEISGLKARVKILEDKDKGREEDAPIKWGDGLVPTVSVILTTASVVTPYSRRPREISAKDKGKEKVVESNVPKKKKLQKYIDAQVTRDIEEEFTRDNQRFSEQLARDSEIARLHAEEELKMMIEDHHAKILKYQAQQRKPLSKKEQREFYMSVLRSHAGWKTKHFRGMTLEEIKEKFIPIWKQIEDFVPMSSKEEGERMKKRAKVRSRECS
nr:hypothetical protein [Tanacetum cinerariifolium]